MPDEPRHPFVPKVRIEPPRKPETGFTARNTSGVDDAGLAALNVALRRLIGRGLGEYEAKQALLHAVAEWLEPKDAAETDIERLLMLAPGRRPGGSGEPQG